MSKSVLCRRLYIFLYQVFPVLQLSPYSGWEYKFTSRDKSPWNMLCSISKSVHYYQKGREKRCLKIWVSWSSPWQMCKAFCIGLITGQKIAFWHAICTQQKEPRQSCMGLCTVIKYILKLSTLLKVSTHMKQCEILVPCKGFKKLRLLELDSHT